jgi:hypothetical protein
MQVEPGAEAEMAQLQHSAAQKAADFEQRKRSKLVSEGGGKADQGERGRPAGSRQQQRQPAGSRWQQGRPAGSRWQQLQPAACSWLSPQPAPHSCFNHAQLK